MRKRIYSILSVLLSVSLFFILNRGYSGIEPNFYQITEQSQSAYLMALLRFDVIVLVVFLLLGICLYHLLRLAAKTDVFLHALVKVIVIFSFLNGIYFAGVNFYRNNIDIFELNMFVELIDHYGVLVNLVYLLPFMFSLCLILFCYWASCLYTVRSNKT